MTSYPPDYDERLLDNAPKATRAEKQEGYNVNLLASDTSETPINTRPPATVDGHTSLEAGVSPTKEEYSSPYSVPWYRQGKWRIIMLVIAIIIIGAVVGGVVGGVLSSKNKGNKKVTPTPTSSTSAVSNAPAGATTANGAPPPGSTPPSSTTSNAAGTVPTAGSSQGGTHLVPNNDNNSDLKAAPIVVWPN